MFSLLLPLLSSFVVALAPSVDSMGVHLDRTDYRVLDTSKYASLRLHVVNPTDSIVIIERVQPSCGCILATVQKSVAAPHQSAEIYVAVTVSKLDSLQPVTIDVYTNRNRAVPMRLLIHKSAAADTSLVPKAR